MIDSPIPGPTVTRLSVSTGRDSSFNLGAGKIPVRLWEYLHQKEVRLRHFVITMLHGPEVGLALAVRSDFEKVTFSQPIKLNTPILEEFLWESTEADLRVPWTIRKNLSKPQLYR